MFHWICPECGREIAPAVRECPVCDPQATVAIAVEPAPQPPPVSTLEPTPFALEPVPPPAVVRVEPAPQLEPETDPLVALALKLREEQQEALARTPPPPGPEPDRIPEIEPALAGRTAVATPAPVAAAAARAPREPEPVPNSVALVPPVGPAPAVPEPPEPAITALSLPRSEPQALASAPAADPEPIPQASLDSHIPGNGPWARLTLPLAALQDYSAAALRAMQPQNTRVAVLRPDSGPRMTLPGPALPAALHSLEAAGLSRILTDRPRKTPTQNSYGWLVSMVVMLGLLMVGITVLFAFLPRATAPAAPPHEVQAADTTPVAVSIPAQQATVAPSATPASYPLAKSVEVTGFRFLLDPAKKPEIHYLVVNHSAAALSDLTVFVTLHTANPKPGQPPLCRFSFRPASLGPYEAKEMVSAIQKLPAGVPLPEWQELKADVELAQ